MNTESAVNLCLWVVAAFYFPAMGIWAYRAGSHRKAIAEAGNAPEFDLNADARRRTRALKRGKGRPFRIAPPQSRSGFLRLEPIVTIQ